MRLLSTALFFVALLMASCADETLGSGKIVEQIRSSGPYTVIRSRGGIFTRVHRGDVCSVMVTIDDNLQPYVLTTLVGDTMDITLSNGDIAPSTALVDVWLPECRAVVSTGSGPVDVVDSTTVDTFDLQVAGSATVAMVGLRAGHVSADLSGSGSAFVTLSRARSVDARVSGSGSFRAFGLTCDTARLDISGSGNAEIRVATLLDGNVSGSGSIIYDGAPELRSSVTGSGSIRVRE